MQMMNDKSLAPKWLATNKANVGVPCLWRAEIHIDQIKVEKEEDVRRRQRD